MTYFNMNSLYKATRSSEEHEQNSNKTNLYERVLKSETSHDEMYDRRQNPGTELKASLLYIDITYKAKVTWDRLASVSVLL